MEKRKKMLNSKRKMKEAKYKRERTRKTSPAYLERHQQSPGF
jgi:hypothetical protein